MKRQLEAVCRGSRDSWELQKSQALSPPSTVAPPRPTPYGPVPASVLAPRQGPCSHFSGQNYLGGEMRPSPHPSRLSPPSLSGALGRRRPFCLRPDIPGIAAHNCTFPGQETSPAGTRSRQASPPLPSGSTEPADPSQMLRGPRHRPGFRPQVRGPAWALAAGPLVCADVAPPRSQVGRLGRPDASFPLSPQGVR